MSNSWNYAIKFSKSISFSDSLFEKVIETVNTAGYPLPNPAFQILGFDLSGDEIVFEHWATAKEHLLNHGASMVLWKGNEDAHLNIGMTFNPNDRIVSFGVIHELRPEHEDDIEIAADLKYIFTALCQRLEPIYGYVADEYGLETVLEMRGKDFVQQWRHFKQAIENLEPPPILFWLNYFSSYYQKHLISDWASFDTIPHRKEILARQGVFIYLAEHPWEKRMGILKANGSYQSIKFS